MILNQYGNAGALASNFVGGEYMHRDHRGDPGARDPFIPVSGAKQRDALKFVQENILSDTAFSFPLSCCANLLQTAGCIGATTV